MSNYDPGRIVATFKGIPVLGFMDGTFIEAQRNEDAFSVAVGAQGDVARVRNRNVTGTVKMTLQAVSPTNDRLSAQHAADVVSGVGEGALLVKDLNGTTLLHAESAWIKKLPDVAYSADLPGREWTFECADLEMVVGGAAV